MKSPSRRASLPRVPRLALVVAALLSAAALVQTPAPASAAAKPRVTVIGDSIQASFEYAPAAVRRLGKGYDLRVDQRAAAVAQPTRRGQAGFVDLVAADPSIEAHRSTQNRLSR